MRYFLALFFGLLFSGLDAQESDELILQAQALEKKMDERGALAVYEKALIQNEKNESLLVKCVELNVSVGSRQFNLEQKTIYFEKAYSLAAKVLNYFPSSYKAYYVVALSAGKMTETDVDNKQIVEYVRQVKVYGDKALVLQPNDAKLNYILGKWHLKMVTLSWVQKAAVKALYGGLPKGSLDSAVLYMEKCRVLDKYFTPNYLDLAVAYNENREPAKAIAILNLLIKLPNRVYDDVVIKEAAKKLLQDLS